MASLRGDAQPKANTDMEISTDDRPVLDEEIWQAWIQKCQLREQATARKLKKLARIAFFIFVVGIVFYLVVVRSLLAMRSRELIEFRHTSRPVEQLELTFHRFGAHSLDMRTDPNGAMSRDTSLKVRHPHILPAPLHG
jgi:glucan phosphoethanolaminetransferase (alkaline phosphatase superfamily)